MCIRDSSSTARSSPVVLEHRVGAIYTDGSVEGPRPPRVDSRPARRTSGAAPRTAHLPTTRCTGTIQRDIATATRPRVAAPRCSRRHLPNNQTPFRFEAGNKGVDFTGLLGGHKRRLGVCGETCPPCAIRIDVPGWEGNRGDRSSIMVAQREPKYSNVDKRFPFRLPIQSAVPLSLC